MRCRQSTDQLHLYIDGVLDERKRRALEEHLAVCAKCRPELQLPRGIVEAVETEPLLEPRADFASRVMAGLPRKTRRGVLSSENTFWVSGVAVASMAATWLSLAYGPQVVGTLQRQISIFVKIWRWVLLALESFLCSERFARGFSTLMGLLLSLVIYELASLIYYTIDRRARHRFPKQPQPQLPT
ncbi:MAG: zf-HC2 domain-containing protein [Candidatus Latescibacteria bacterium]|nr:zf-HC2 domain-containing protein [Candidatus Latescibacterota bacterium]